MAGANQSFSLIARGVTITSSSQTAYLARVRIETGNILRLYIIRKLAGVETPIGSAHSISLPQGYTPGQKIWCEVSVLDTNPTTLGAKMWLDGSSEPSLYQVQGTDTTSELQATGYFNAKKMPMKAHENILVFYKNSPKFNPQKTVGHKPVNTYTKKAEVCNKTEVYGKVKQDVSGGGETDRYPRSVQVFASDKQKTKLDGTIHPTQKPLALLEMLVKSYTNENDMILDNTMGSGTTNLACLKLNRKSIGIEKEKQYYDVAVRRLSSYCG
jgi:site-specific DNA-methyltransferase (adenine-specific)